MFQWDYDKLVEEVRNDLYIKLDELVEQYSYVSSYHVDEAGKVITILYDSKLKKRSDLFVNDFEIEEISYLLARLTRSEGEYQICIV